MHTQLVAVVEAGCIIADGSACLVSNKVSLDDRWKEKKNMNENSVGHT